MSGPEAGAPISISRNGILVLELSSTGMNTKEIAEHLGVNPQTVDSRMERVRHLLGASTRTHATAIAMASGLIAGPEPMACVAGRNYLHMTEFVEDYGVMARRGLNDSQIAEVIGVKVEAIKRRVLRARRAGLLPPLPPGQSPRRRKRRGGASS